jgi:hypothetical protein
MYIIIALIIPLSIFSSQLFPYSSDADIIGTEVVVVALKLYIHILKVLGSDLAPDPDISHSVSCSVLITHCIMDAIKSR